MRVFIACLILIFGVTGASVAQPLHYLLDPSRSIVGFELDFGQNLIRGRMPVSDADLTLDFEQVAASHVRVTLKADAARADLPFATQAMRGENVLATRSFPLIRFESTSVRASETGAIVSGNITIRDITHPVMLNARIFRAKGTEEGERDNLAVQLTGTVSRSAFGAVGYADLVGDEVRLNIVAYIQRKG